MHMMIIDMDDKDCYRRWNDYTCAMIAKYTSWCGYCDRKILRERSRIMRVRGAWLHQRCAQKVIAEERALVA
jgi:hypothetical protein